MRAAVVIPTFDLGKDDCRVRAFDRVRDHIASLGWPVKLPPGTNPAIARNRGRDLDCDVLVFNDADTLVPLEQITEAIQLAAASPGLVFAFTEYRRLGGYISDHLRETEDAFVAPAFETFIEPPSHGCVTISRDCFVETGGYDERLEVFEDIAFTAVCEERWAGRRVDGPAVHLWHSRVGEPGDPAFEERYAASREVWEANYPSWVAPHG